MNTTLITLFSGLISGTITAIIAYFATRSKAVLDLTIEYDKELRKERLTSYQLLWPKLKPMARYSPERPLTYQIVKDTSEQMRDWYFSNEGIFLSARSRKSYFELKAAMQGIIDNKKLQPQPEKSLDGHLIKSLHDCATALRADLSDDVGTRRKPFI